MISTDNIFVGPSELEGVGVFAKKDFKEGEIIHTDIAFLLPSIICTNTYLESYVYDSEYAFANLLVMGAGSFLNGILNEANVWTRFEEGEEGDHILAHIVADRNIKQGEELILDYHHEEG